MTHLEFVNDRSGTYLLILRVEFTLLVPMVLPLVAPAAENRYM